MDYGELWLLAGHKVGVAQPLIGHLDRGPRGQRHLLGRLSDFGPGDRRNLAGDGLCGGRRPRVDGDTYPAVLVTECGAVGRGAPNPAFGVLHREPGTGIREPDDVIRYVAARWHGAGSIGCLGAGGGAWGAAR